MDTQARTERTPQGVNQPDRSVRAQSAPTPEQPQPQQPWQSADAPAAAPSSAPYAQPTASTSATPVEPQAPRQPYRHHAAHITQDPIVDDGISYQHAPDPRGAATVPGRRHMGTATSDPQYLPPTDRRGQRPASAAGGAGPRGTGERRAQLHYERYLETPKPGKSIFTSRYERSRRRSARLVIVVLVLAVLVGLVWFFFLR